MKRTGGEWVVDALAGEGVRHVFGIPGVHNLAVYDALLRQSTITHVLARHEQGAAFMADGYARASGTPGVVIVTSGPAATNTITPLAESYSGSVPVVVIMSDIASHLVGRDLGALHEVPNQIDCFRPVTRWAEALTDGAAIPATIAGAFELLRTGRPGPIAISIPNDLLGATVASALAPRSAARRPPCHVADVQAAARLLRDAERPLIIAGGGVVASHAGHELTALAERLQAPVVSTVSGRGAVTERHPLWHSVLPDRRATARALAAADVVLAVGTKLGHRSMEKLGIGVGAPGQTLIHLDLDPGVIGRQYKATLALVGDARDGLAGLAAALGEGDPRARWDRAWLASLRADAGPRFTREVADAIGAVRRSLPSDAIVVNDQTGLTYWMEHRFPVLVPRTFLYPTGSAVLGYAVPAAIGAKLARPDRVVIAVAGDGGFMFSVAELATAVKYRLNIVFLVVNDDRFGAIEYLQRTFYGRWGEADLTNPDFVALAHAFGARGEQVPAIEALPEAVARALAADGPTLLELRLSLEPPWEF